MRPKFHTLRVKEVRRETPESVSVEFEVPAELKDDYRFSHGQNLTLRHTINGEDIRRSYSICSAQHEGQLRVAVKEVPKGAFSTWVNQHLKAGDQLQVMTPSGNFTTTLDAAHKKHYLLVAAGSGITPVISIAKAVLHTEPQSEVTLIYGNRHFKSIIFREELENMKDSYLGRFRLFHLLSGEPNEIELFHGRIGRDKLEVFGRTFIDIASIDEAFICGPEPMIREVSAYLEEKGVAKNNIHFELFATPGQVVYAPHAEKSHQPKGKQCHVSVIYDGHISEFDMPLDGSRLLDTAQQKGLDLPFSCKGGMCCTCRAHVDEGEVDMVVNYALEPGEVENGFVLTCQSVPLTENLTINFDRQ